MSSRLRNIYKLMKYRCAQPKYDKYQYYGERGIKVCPEWADSFDAFEGWALEHGYKEGLTLDRIDNNGNYSPDNCRWVTIKEQANNRSSNHFITYNGETKTLQQWAETLGMTASGLENRFRTGWDLDRVFTEERHETRYETNLTFNGKTQRAYEWAKELGIKKNTIYNRLKKYKWSVEKTLSTPVKGGSHND